MVTYLTDAVLQLYQIIDETSKVIGHHWKNVMIVPALIVLMVAVLFTVYFKNEKENIILSDKRLL